MARQARWDGLAGHRMDQGVRARQQCRALLLMLCSRLQAADNGAIFDRMATNDHAAKMRLQIGIEVLQRYGREGTIVADQLLKEMPIESPEFDRKQFFAEIEERVNA